MPRHYCDSAYGDERPLSPLAGTARQHMRLREKAGGRGGDILVAVLCETLWVSRLDEVSQALRL